MSLLIAVVFTAPAMAPWLLLHGGRRMFLPLAAVPLAGAGWVIMTICSQLPFLLNPELLPEILSGGSIDPAQLADILLHHGS